MAAASLAKMAEAPQQLQRCLLGFEQGRRVGADPVQGVSPFRARRTLRMEPKRRRIEEDALAFHLFDHRSLGEHVLERDVIRQEAADEIEAA